ncbi:MAG TPA: mucoidy inhibitor MuiA family protein [Saprospiraceae bacterium]|nr:mucoidy inhibitor MuiA family protein [Saprospiraceae bacterium]
MKRSIVVSLLMFYFLSGYCASQDSIRTSIKKVTLFTKGAQIYRSGKIKVKKGVHTYIVGDVCPDLIDGTVRVTLSQQVQIMGLNYSSKLSPDAKDLASIKAKIEEINTINNQKALLDLEKSALKYERSILEKNQEVAGTTNGLNSLELMKTVAFQRGRMDTILRTTFGLDQNLQMLQEKIDTLNKHIQEIKQKPVLSKGEIALELRSEMASEHEIEITYIVENAGWFVSYDARIKEVGAPVNLVMKANIRQYTREDWKDVKLTLSNGSPNENGVAPKLLPFYLSFWNGYVKDVNFGKPSPFAGQRIKGKVYDQNNEPLIGANIVVINSSIGTVSDVDGNFELMLPASASDLEISYLGFTTAKVNVDKSFLNIFLKEDGEILDEVVVVGYALTGAAAGVTVERNKADDKIIKDSRGPSTTLVYQPTTVQYEIAEILTVPSSGENKSFEVTHFDIPADYNYHIVPKVEKAAYLNAKLHDWRNLNLLAGETNIYFEGSFIGKSIIEPSTLLDTMSLSLGKDASVVVDYTEIRDFHVRSEFRNKESQKKEFEIGVKNFKNKTVQVSIFDQFPISTDKSIKVSDQKYKEGGVLNPDTQIIEWRYALQPGQTEKLRVSYQVEYPLGTSLNW